MADCSASGSTAGGSERVGASETHVPPAGYRKPPSGSEAGRRPTCEAGEHLCRRRRLFG